jgi:hypothetical protein
MYPSAYLDLPGFREPALRRVLLGLGWTLLTVAIAGTAVGLALSLHGALLAGGGAAVLAAVVVMVMPEPLPAPRPPSPWQRRFDHPLPR